MSAHAAGDLTRCPSNAPAAGIHAATPTPASFEQRRRVDAPRQDRWRSSCWSCSRSAPRARWSAACRTRARSRPAPPSAASSTCSTAQPQRGGAGQTLSLPGTLQGFVQSPISARASGYLKRWYKDIGSRVEQGRAAGRDRDAGDRPAAVAGDRRARAGRLEPRARARAPSSAGRACARRTRCRSRSSTSAAAPYAQARANLAAADANVERLRQLEGFKRVRRAVRRRDHAAQRRRRRPDRRRQRRRPRAVRAGADRSAARLRERAADLRAAREAGPAGDRDAGRAARPAPSRARSRAPRRRSTPTTRTMQIEVALPNRDGMLLPGAYVQVALPLPPSGALTHPDQRAADPRRGHARRGGRRAGHGAAAPGRRSAATTARRSRCSTASPRPTSWCSTRPIRSPTATVVRSRRVAPQRQGQRQGPQ